MLYVQKYKQKATDVNFLLYCADLRQADNQLARKSLSHMQTLGYYCKSCPKSVKSAKISSTSSSYFRNHTAALQLDQVEIMKLFSCSTQLRMIFQLLIIAKML